jgi:hypothetical protein
VPLTVMMYVYSVHCD